MNTKDRAGVTHGMISAVLFDVDGVLVDSLGEHLRICSDLSVAYGLRLPAPSPGWLRGLVDRGVKISPMLEFFRAAGFPEAEAARADAEYRARFSTDYAPVTFAGAGSMLARIAASGVLLGYVTSNTRTNVERALGRQLLATFSTGICFAVDDAPARTKAEALSAARDVADGGPIVYVGDQPSDALAAEAAGAKFVAVKYGWSSFAGRDGARSPAELGDIIMQEIER